MKPSESQQEPQSTPLQDRALRFSKSADSTRLSETIFANSTYSPAISAALNSSIPIPLSENEPTPIREPHPTPIEANQRDLQNALTPPSKSFSTYSTPRAGYTTPDGSPIKRPQESKVPRRVELGDRQPLEERKANAEPQQSVEVLSGNVQSVEVVDEDGPVGGK
ncbi:hypothetical protein IAR50_003678 [Cryptococcus sp. DSM 104548]